MKNDLLTIAIIQRSSNLDGSAISGLQIADGMRNVGFKTHTVFGFNGRAIEKYLDNGHQIHIVPHDNWLRNANTLGFIKNISKEVKTSSSFVKLYREIKPDLIYVNSMVSLAAVIAANFLHIPIIWHLREMFKSSGGEMYSPEWALPIIRRLILWKSDFIITTSKASLNNLLNMRDSNKTEVIPNAVNGEYFHDNHTKKDSRKNLCLPEDALIIGVPGTLRPVKGHKFFLATIANQLKVSPQLVVAISGGGEQGYVDSLKKLVSELEITKQVKFLGWLKNMPQFYNACDIICIPSEMESFGRTVIEAFASKRPVIASDVGGMSEIIIHKKTGFLFSPHDSDNMLLYLNQLIKSQVLRERIGQEAYKVAQELYKEKKYQLRILDVVNKVYNHNYSSL